MTIGIGFDDLSMSMLVPVDNSAFLAAASDLCRYSIRDSPSIDCGGGRPVVNVPETLSLTNGPVAPPVRSRLFLLVVAVIIIAIVITIITLVGSVLVRRHSHLRLRSTAVPRLPALLTCGAPREPPSHAATVAAFNLQTRTSDLVQNVTAAVVHSTLRLIPPRLHEKIHQTLTDASAASYTSVAALVLSLLFLLVRYLMSGYGSRPVFGGGRAGGSPYTSGVPDPSPRNLSHHFEYIDADHGMLQDPRRPVANTTRVPAVVNQAWDEPDPPDTVGVRYMNTTFTVEFPAYSINEENALVGQLRETVARTLKTDPRRIKLLYKKRDLKHDSRPLRKYNMKQNSEVTAIKLESNFDTSDRDDYSTDDDSGSSQAGPTARRPRALSSVRYRSEDQVPPPRPSPSAFLHPNGFVPSHPPPGRGSRVPPAHEPPRDRREPSQTRGASPAVRPSPSTTPVPSSIPPADPSTPLGKLQGLAQTFHDEWLPLCRRFLANPPADPAARDKEHRKLSETVMVHVLLKADAISVDSPETRAVRKSLINEANEVIANMDALVRA